MKFWNEITANSLQYGSNFKTWVVMNQQMNSILYILGLCYYVYSKFILSIQIILICFLIYNTWNVNIY